MKKTQAAMAVESELALKAALALVELIPSDVPLAVRSVEADDLAPTGAGVVANVVGAVSAELVVVVGETVDRALGGAGGASVSLADALRPSLQAASDSFGEGVLSDVRIAPDASDLLVVPGTHLFALTVADEVQGWFAVRIKQAPAAAAPAPEAKPVDEKNIRPMDLTNMSTMRMLYDVEMTLTAEIGRAKLPVRQVLELVPGAVIELDRVAGSPADLMVNGRLIARGEVVVVDEDYGLRVTEIVDLGQAGL